MRGPYAVFSREELVLIDRKMPSGHHDLPDEDKLLKSIHEKCEAAISASPKFREPHE